MSRQARKFSASGFYHIVFRGVNRQHLFEDDSDYVYLIKSINQLKTEMVFEIHAYCLMSNHVHLLLKENQVGDISVIMKRLLTKYAMYFNRKYERCGALISSRYKSSPVEVDQYFIPLICYIHQNPVRAGMVGKSEEYRFSSFMEYVSDGTLVNTTYSLELLGKSEWIRLHQNFNSENFEITGKNSLSEDDVRRKILQYTSGRDPHEIISWLKNERNALLRRLKEEGMSIRQIERATGISRGIVAKS